MSTENVNKPIDMDVDMTSSDCNDKKSPAISPGFKTQGRYCWGGMSRWLFIVLCIFLGLTAFLALMVPLGLYVIVPHVAQQTVDKSSMTAKNLRINGWGTNPGKIEAEMWKEYEAFLLPMAAMFTNNPQMMDKEYFLSQKLVDFIDLENLGFEMPAGLPIDPIQILLQDMDRLVNMPIGRVLENFELGSCSQFQPEWINATLDVEIENIPSIMHGSISASYLDLHIPGDADSWGRIAIPYMDVNNVVDGKRLIKDVPVSVRVDDRYKWLQANAELLHIAPFTSGTTYWTQKGKMFINLDLGVTHSYEVDFDQVTKISGASFNAGPFSVPNPAIGGLEINDPYSFVVCLALDLAPRVINGFMNGELSDLMGMLPKNAQDFSEELNNRRRSEVENLSQKITQQFQNLFSNVEKCQPFANQTIAEMIETGVQDQAMIQACMEALLHEADAKAANTQVTASQHKLNAKANNWNKDPKAMMRSGLNYVSKMMLGKDDAAADVADDVATAAGVDEAEDNFTTCNLTVSGECKFADMKPQQADLKEHAGHMVKIPSIKIGTESDPFEIYGQTPKCLGNTEYQFQVLPGKGENKSKVLLYFQGGGAEWRSPLTDPIVLGSVMKSNFLYELTGMNLTETGDMLRKLSMDNLAIPTAGIVPNMNDGVLNQQNPQNPFADWTIVQVMYCSGDMHMGSLPADGEMSGALVFLLAGDATDAKMIPRRMGSHNTMAVLEWMKEQPELANPENLVIMGCSAGALGAQAWAPKAMEMLGANETNTVIVPDSFVGAIEKDEVKNSTTGQFEMLMTEWGGPACMNVSTSFSEDNSQTVVSPAGEALMDSWNACDTLEQKFATQMQGSELVNMCRNKTMSTSDLFNHNFNIIGKTPVAFISSKADSTQRKFNTFIEMFGGNKVGLQTTNAKKPKLVSSVRLGDHASWCDAYSDKTKRTYSFCEEMTHCLGNTADEANIYYNDIGMNTPHMWLGMTTITWLEDLSAATKFRSGVEPLLNRFISAFQRNYIGGDGTDIATGGEHGEALFWGKTRKIMSDYEHKQKSWFVTADDTHCFTCNEGFYTTEVNGVTMVDWMNDILAKLENNNTEVVQKVCDEAGLECPDIVKSQN